MFSLIEKSCFLVTQLIIMLLFQTKDVLEKNFKEKAEAAGATTQAHKLPQAPAPGSKYTPQDVLEVCISFY